MRALETAYHQSQIAGKIYLLLVAKESIIFDKNVKTFAYMLLDSFLKRVFRTNIQSISLHVETNSFLYFVIQRINQNYKTMWQ